MTQGRIDRIVWPCFVAACLYALATFQASLTWLDRPFPGAFVLWSCRVDALVSGDWNGLQAGLQVGDRIRKVDGLDLPDGQALYRYVAARPIGTPFRYDLERSGRELSLTIPSQRFEVADWVDYHLVFWLIGVIHLVLGALVAVLRPSSRAAVAHWWFCLALGVFMLGVFAELTAEPRLFVFGILGQALIGMTSVHLAASLPRLWPVWERWPGLAILNRVGGGFLALGLMLAVRLGQSHAAGMAILAYSSLGCLVLLASAAWGLLSRSSSPQERAQARIILIGACGAFVPSIAVTSISHATGLAVPDREWTHLTVSFFPMAVAYAIVRRQLFDVGLIARRVTLYALVTAAGAGLYVAVVAAVTGLLGRLAADRVSSLSEFFGALVVAFALRPVYQLLRLQVDRLFRRERADIEGALAQFGNQPFTDPTHVAESLLRVLEGTFAPDWQQLSLDGQTVAERGAVPSRGSAEGDDGQHLMVPLRRGQGGQGWLRLGPRRTGNPYGADDRALVKALAVQVEVALEKARLFEERAQLLVNEGVARTLADAQRQVLRQVLHDLRSDLFNISVAAERARRSEDPTRPIESIQRSVDRIERLLVDKQGVLTAAAPPAGLTSLSRCLAEAAEVLGGKLEAKQQRLAVDAAADVMVPLTSAACHQVLINLIDNASKYAPAQSTVTVSVTGDDATVRIQVADAGPGIPAALLDRLGSGDRADPSVPGLGFGLQNVRALVMNAGGGVRWWNTGLGAIVEVWLPKWAGGG